METAHDFNERAPLLGNGATYYNEHRQLYAISETSTEQTPPEENRVSNEHGQLDGDCAISNGQSTPSAPDTRIQIASCPKTYDQETNEVSLKEIAQALCSAWRQNSECKFNVNQDYFTTKELYAMHLAWKNVTRRRHCPFPAPTIVEAVALAIATHLHGPCQDGPHNDESNYNLCVNIDKCTLAVSLLREWSRITEGVGFPVRYIQTVVANPDDQTFEAAQLWNQQQVELYDKVHDFILSRKFQCILHTLLIIWPLSLIIVGAKYADCPVSHLLSYQLISLGCVGIVAIFVRQGLMYSMFYAEYSRVWSKEWVGLRFIELIFFLEFLLQAFHFFHTYPMAESGAKQCAQNFYDAALILNYVSFPIVCMYLVSYLVIICANQLDCWLWVLRHL